MNGIVLRFVNLNMPKRFFELPNCLGALALSLTLSAGCVTGVKMTPVETSASAHHPYRETRMSCLPQPGYVPCGVWRVRGTKNTIYLAGTSHVVPKDQVPFPSPFYAAYLDSKEIYTEFNTANAGIFTKMHLLFQMWGWLRRHETELLCPPGKTLKDYLASETVRGLQAFYGRSYAKQEHLTPLFLLLMNEVEGGPEETSGASGVEDYFTALARHDHKPIRCLEGKETARTAVKALDLMLMNLKLEIGQRGADAVIKEKIMGGGGDEGGNDVWRRGDLAAVEKALGQMKADSSALFQMGVSERNRQWVVRLKDCLQKGGNVLVLVGVAHLGGQDGLVESLRGAGFTVEQMYGLDRPH